jgi:hypothetical protein
MPHPRRVLAVARATVRASYVRLAVMGAYDTVVAYWFTFVGFLFQIVGLVVTAIGFRRT